jgi:hypothetical protein
MSAFRCFVGRLSSCFQEAAAAAAAWDASIPTGWLHWPANKLLDLFESPELHIDKYDNDKMAPYEAHLRHFTSMPTDLWQQLPLLRFNRLPFASAPPMHTTS